MFNKRLPSSLLYCVNLTVSLTNRKSFGNQLRFILNNSQPLISNGSGTVLLVNDLCRLTPHVNVLRVSTAARTFVLLAVVTVCCGELVMHGCTVGTGSFVCALQKCPACLFPHNNVA